MRPLRSSWHVHLDHEMELFVRITRLVTRLHRLSTLLNKNQRGHQCRQEFVFSGKAQFPAHVHLT